MLSYDNGESFFREMSDNKIEPLILAMDEYFRCLNKDKLCWGIWDNSKQQQIEHKKLSALVFSLTKK